MREFKFKAWDKKNRRMLHVVSMHRGCDTTGVCGWFVTVERWLPTLGLYGNPDIISVADQYELTPSEHELLEYTGHKDGTKWEQMMDEERIEVGGTKETWNGKEIYEGDILMLAGSKPVVVTFGKQEWLEDFGDLFWYIGFNHPIGGSGYGQVDAEWDEYEIIGNIYENPELVK